MTRIQALLQRRSPEAHGDVVEIRIQGLDRTRHRVAADGRTITLSATEFRLLYFFTTHKALATSPHDRLIEIDLCVADMF